MGGLLSCKDREKERERQYMRQPDPVTGINRTEVNLIRTSWKAARTKFGLTDTGVTLFIKTFEMYPELKPYFTILNDIPLEELRNSERMRAHATAVMYAVSAYVDMVDDSSTLVALIEKIAYSHVPRKVSAVEIKKMSHVLLCVLSEGLGPACTPETALAWNKFLDLHSTLFDNYANRFKEKLSLQVDEVPDEKEPSTPEERASTIPDKDSEIS